ncbi:hypothetical protein UFOVP484_1, partial [uncultured Caudovirales phage]
NARAYYLIVIRAGIVEGLRLRCTGIPRLAVEYEIAELATWCR